MSVSLMGIVWALKLDHAKRMVMLALADHADDDGANVFPSVAHTAWKTGYSDRQVRRIIRTLQAAGLLLEVAPATARRPTEYRIDVAAGVMKAPFRGAAQRGDEVSALSGAEGGHLDRSGRTSEAARADIAVSAESSKEPSEEREKLKEKELQIFWGDVVAHLRQSIPESRVDTYIAPLQPVEATRSGLVLFTPDHLDMEMVRVKFGAAIRDSAAEVGLSDPAALTVEFQESTEATERRRVRHRETDRFKPRHLRRVG